MNLAGIDWGDAPTWCGVVAATAAGVFAALSFLKLREQVADQRQALDEQRTFIADQRALMADQAATMAAERAELAAAADARKAEQARKVVMTIERVPDAFMAYVTNNSDGPLRDVTVKFGTYHASHAVESNISVGGALTRGPQRNAPVDVVGAGRRFAFVLSRLSETTLANSRPVLTFKDEAGVGWRLDEHGLLTCTD